MLSLLFDPDTAHWRLDDLSTGRRALPLTLVGLALLARIGSLGNSCAG